MQDSTHHATIAQLYRMEHVISSGSTL